MGGGEHGALHQVFQLPNVAGQGLRLQPMGSGGAQVQGGALVGGAQLGHKVAGQRRNIAGPLAQGGQAQLLFKVTDRAVMSYTNAKRLAMSLSQLVKRYEQQFGEIPMQPGQPRK